MTIDSNTQALALQPPYIPYHIRRVQASDLRPLRQDCWSHRSITRSREQLKIVLGAAKGKRGFGIVVEATNTANIIAYGQIIMLVKCTEISDLIVAPAFRNQGIGTAMIQYLIGSISNLSIKQVEIGVAASNPRALALYTRLGFTKRYELMLNLGNGKESVIYLGLDLPS